MIKVFLEYSEGQPLISDDSAGFIYLPIFGEELDKRSPYYCLNVIYYSPYSGILCFIGGEASIDLETVPEKWLGDFVHSHVLKAFPNSTDYTNILVSSWNADPFTKGCYSFQSVGFSAADREPLAEPVGSTLFFAGEHVSVNPAYVHGAWDSGVKAAMLAINATAEQEVSGTVESSGESIRLGISGFMMILIALM